MKRFLFSMLCSLLVGTMAQAQVNMQDSTVQAVAYWHLGEKFDYVFHGVKYKVQENDTTITEKYSMPFTVEVVDSTATSYTLEFKEEETHYEVMDENTRMMMAAGLDKLGKGMPLRIRTNEFGLFQSVENVPQLMSMLKEATEKVGESLRKEAEKKMPADQVEVMMKSVQPLLDGLCNEQMVLAMVKPFLNLIYFHGTKMEFDASFTANTKSETHFAVGVLVDCENEFWVDSVDPESSYTTYGAKTYFNSDQLIQAYLKYVGKMLPDGTEIPDSPDRPYIFVNELRGITVHTDSGVTTSTFYRSNSTTGKLQAIEEQEIEFVFE